MQPTVPSVGDLPRDADPVIFRTPAAARWLSLFAVVLLAGVSAMTLVFAIVLLWQRPSWIGLFVAAIACFMGGLTGYGLRDLRGRWGLRVELWADRIVLDLPAGRSLIHRPPAQRGTIRYSDIDAIETRLEGYPSLGMETLQRAYVLSHRQAGRIFLFEDRAIGNALQASTAAKVAAAIVAHAHVPLRDLGMVEGRGGILCVWGTETPDWAAPSLPLAQQLRIWRHVAATGTISLAVLLVALALRLVIGS